IPATSLIHHNIHSTEIGASQTSVQLVYELATGTDEVTRVILDDMVTVLIPSGNPDGQIMVTDWYRENVGTEHERARMPRLYHHYAGHDNNRDFFQANLVETRYWMDLMYHGVHPQLYLDQHQMGGRGPRIFVPPYPDPMNPEIHPLQWQQLRFIGGGMVADLQAEGKEGVVTGSMYRIWGQEGALTGRYHNIVALLTETASARIASPDTVELDVLERGASPGRGLSEYGFQMAFVDPWMGGEWTLGDIVEYQMIAARSFLEQGARFHEHYILGRWQMASETIEKGLDEGPGAYVIPIDQSDPIAAAELVDKLIRQGVEVHRTTETFAATPQLDVWFTPEDGTLHVPGPDGDEDRTRDLDEGAEDEGEDAGPESPEPDEEAAKRTDRAAQVRASEGPERRTIPEGSWMVFGAQPGRAAVLDLLEIQNRRLEREWPGGPFKRSYDGAAYTMPLQMGVAVLRVDRGDVGTVTRTRTAGYSPPPVPAARTWYAFTARSTRNYEAVNRLLAAGIPVSRAESPTGPFFVVPATHDGVRRALSRLSTELGTTFLADPSGLERVVPQRRARIGLYQGWAASMDEGWTRFVLEDFGFSYVSLSNDDIRDPTLGERLDVLVVPSDISLDRLIEGSTSDETPPKYRGGIGDDGVERLKEFVRAGGVLVTLEEADELVVERFHLPVRDAADGVGPEELFLPASLLRVELDPRHPLAMGSPDEVAGKWAGGRAYELHGFSDEVGEIRAVGRWASQPERVLMSGLLHGAEHLAGKAAILDVEYGQGRILMYGFRVQHRGQTHGTFKLLFNALVLDDHGQATDR
ncbi:MAG: M14 family metallopeptidase, partial [Longimicrobiales bacterium]|nr:M14 family metallopeptidase [Longimicrobiales bacterium]